MAEDITLNQGTVDGTGFTFSGLDSLNDDTSTTSTNSPDLGATSEVLLGLEIKLTGSGSAAGCCYVYLQWSYDNSDFSDSDNDQPVAVVQMAATAQKKKNVTVSVQARYVKCRVYNGSGAALGSSGNSITFAPIAVDQA